MIIQINKNEEFLKKMMYDKNLFTDMHRNTVNMFAVLAYLKLMVKHAIENPESTDSEKKVAMENLNILNDSSAFLKEYANILL